MFEEMADKVGYIIGGIVAVLGGGLLLASSARKPKDDEPRKKPSPYNDFLPGDIPEGEGASVEPDSSQPIINRIAEGQAKLAARTANDGTKRTRGTRPTGMSEVDGLVLHQTGFSRGNAIDRYDGITSHFVILPNGQIIQLHPLDEYLYASNNFNRYTVAVEFVGNFPNDKGNWWKGDKFGRNNLSQAQINAGRWLVDYLREEMPRLGSPGLNYVYAHRQSSASRGNDPGPDVWYNVGHWAAQKRGLPHTPTGDDDYTVGSGNPIKSSWKRPSNNKIA